jgi:hypothetical protein
MELLDEGNSIITAIWDKSKRDVIVTLGGEQKARAITSVEVFYGEGGSIWLAALERKGIWAQSEITAENVKKETVLKWSVPFRAKWKGNFMRADRTMDSWEFRYNLSDAASRRHWGSYTVYYWPCWFVEKPATKAMIQPPTPLPNGNYAGPFVVYPIERTPETPLDQLTVTDLMRNSLGVGPCEYVMDMAGQTVTNKGIATCGLAEAAPRIFAFGRQKEERMYLRAMLAEVQVFMQTIQDRLNSYVDFRTDVLQYLEAQRAARPDLADFVRRLEDQAKRIHDKKSDAAARVAKMATDFEPGIMADAPRSNPLDILSQVKNTGQWQDATLARCRQTVKVLRQMATVEMAVNPKAADIAKELRERTHRALRSPLGHEMGR